MNTTTPNLFHYATKELAQDAALAYILTWARPAYRESHPRIYRLGTAMLHSLLATKIGETAVPAITALDIKTQYDHIDLLVRINDVNEDGLVLLVEDKVDTDEHSDQINHYIASAKKHYPNREIIPVYVKTGNASWQSLPPEEKCGRFLRRDLLKVLDRFPDTGDTIVDNFRAHLQDWESETNSYRYLPPSEWRWGSMEGFYTELQNRMEKEAPQDCGDWGYAPNPAGGLLWFYFAENTMARKPHEVTMYLQIENATRLTVRLVERSGPGIRAPLMYKVLELLKDNARQASDIRIKKAGRFRGGASAAVAEVTFGDGESYLALADEGAVDMVETVRRLDRARGSSRRSRAYTLIEIEELRSGSWRSSSST